MAGLPLINVVDVSLIGATGCRMCASGVLWWDREFDHDGKTIRMDVRAAARQLWDSACQQTTAYLGDASEAPGLMEVSVIQIPRYLEGNAISLVHQDPSALLICAFYRNLRRYVSRVRRLELRAEFPSVCDNRSSVDSEDCRLDAEKIISQLSERAREMFELRKQGYDWGEIARRLNTTYDAARTEFSREIRRMRIKLAIHKNQPNTGNLAASKMPRGCAAQKTVKDINPSSNSIP